MYTRSMKQENLSVAMTKLLSGMLLCIIGTL